jgi:hypothetical protein
MAMNKRKIREVENERIALDDWRQALIHMDATLKTAQTSVRELERVVINIRNKTR